MGAKIQAAMRLILLSSEFHTTNMNMPSKNQRSLVEQPQPSGSKYKAVVVLFLAGAADSFNMLVPHSKCGNFKNDSSLYDEYAEVRGESNAHVFDSLFEIDAGSASTQPCEKFGLH